MKRMMTGIKMGLIKEILFWLFIFVIGSLIISFIIDPSSFSQVKSRIINLLPDKEVEVPQKVQTNTNYQDIKKLNIKEFSNPLLPTCSAIELQSNHEGYDESEVKKVTCSQMCHTQGYVSSPQVKYSYYSNECINDELICYCSI